MEENVLTEGLASYLIKAVEPIHATIQDRNFPVWTMTPHSEVSHLALFVGALCSGLDDLGAFRNGPGQVDPCSAPLPAWEAERQRLRRLDAYV